MYEKTISELKDLKSIASHITSLGKLMNKTEDTQRQKLLAEVIMELRCMHISPDFKYESTPLNLINGKSNTIRELIDYCMNFITAQKREWQVLAERHGWAPK